MSWIHEVVNTKKIDLRNLSVREVTSLAKFDAFYFYLLKAVATKPDHLEVAMQQDAPPPMVRHR